MFIAPHDIGEDTVLVPSTNVGTVDVEGRSVLVDEAAGRGWALNPTASVVWKVLDGVTPLGDLIDDLSAAFEAERTDVADSVRPLVQNFGLLGLLDNVVRRLDTVPIDVEFVDRGTPDDCLEPDALDGRRPPPDFDSRYLAAPPNG